MTEPTAYAWLSGGETAPELGGVVKFFQTGQGVIVEANVFRLPGEHSIHGFHIHEGSGCGGAGFAETGNHFDPEGAEHPYHAGDLPPLFSCGGRAYMQVLTDRFRVSDVIGRTVVIHSGPDDFRTQPGGDSGEKIGCGVIRKR